MLATLHAPFDSVLVLSFGGPEGPDDVRPFLENVTRGRGVPPERLDEVAEHYLHFGGVSPINEQNRDLIARMQALMAQRGIALPVYFGNRNWHPMVEDTVAEMYAAGHRRALVFTTSAWGGFSGCGQYHDDIARALEALAASVGEAHDPMVLRKLPHYWDRPEMVATFADAIRAAQAKLPSDPNEHVRLVFTAHSIPTAADKNAGPPQEGGHLYSRQVHAAAAAAAEAAGFAEYDVVWQSRSGPPQCRGWSRMSATTWRRCRTRMSPPSSSARSGSSPITSRCSGTSTRRLPTRPWSSVSRSPAPRRPPRIRASWRWRST